MTATSSSPRPTATVSASPRSRCRCAALSGVRYDPNNPVVGVTGVRETSGVFLIGDDGRGTVRLMPGFSQNKAPGAGGKQAMKADRLVGIEQWAAGRWATAMTS